MSERTQPFNPRLVFGVIAAGIVAFAVLVLLIAYGDRLGGVGRGDGRAHALSSSAVGYRGLVSLVGNFRETRLVRDNAALADENLLIVTPEITTDPDDFARLVEARGARPTLVILPKWATLPDPAHRGWVHVLGPGLGRATSRFVGKSATVDLARADDDRPRMVRGVDLLTAVTALVPSLPQVVSGDNVTPLLALPDGGALIARVGKGQLYVAADPDLFDNHGLKDPRTARAAIAIIDALNETGTRRVDFDLTMNGFGTAARKEHPNMLRTALEPPFLAMTLALLVAALLAGLHGAFRFGPIRRPVRALAFGKAALVENSAGLIRLARREATLGPAYVEVLRQEAARAAYLPPTVQGDQLDAHLDRLTRRGDSFSTHALRLSHAYDRAGLVAAARALFQWKKDNIR